MDGVGANPHSCGPCEKKNGHTAQPKRASAPAPLRTGADLCKRGVGAGSSAGADTEPNRVRVRIRKKKRERKKKSDITPDTGGHRPLPCVVTQREHAFQTCTPWLTASDAGGGHALDDLAYASQSQCWPTNACKAFTAGFRDDEVSAVAIRESAPPSRHDASTASAWQRLHGHKEQVEVEGHCLSKLKACKCLPVSALLLCGHPRTKLVVTPSWQGVRFNFCALPG